VIRAPCCPFIPPARIASASPSLAMADGGVDYIRGTESALKKLYEEVAGLTEVTNRLRSDITLEAKLRGGDVSTLQHKLSSDLVSEIATLRKESQERFTALEAESRAAQASLRQELAELRPRIDGLDAAVLQRKDEIQQTNDRCASIEKDVQIVRGELSAVGDKFASQIIIVTTQADTDREVAASATRVAAAKAMHDFQRTEERIDTLTHNLEASKKALLADITTVAAKLDGVEAFAYTRAKAADVQALELRMNETIEKSLRQVNEELSRKEYCTNVKSLSDRLMTLSLDVNANDVKSKAGDESLSKQIATLEQSIAKTNRQLDQDRDRANEAWVSMERECGTKAKKNDLDAATVRLSILESTVQPMVPSLSMKAEAHDVKQVASRVLALEQVYPTKADASELPKIHLMLADSAAKHEGIITRAQEQHNRQERFDDILREQHSKLDGVHGKTQDLQNAVAAKADSESVFTKESSTMMLQDYYRREEVDGMMTRVWWRVGEGAKSTKLR